jgi:hypothetical protein
MGTLSVASMLGRHSSRTFTVSALPSRLACIRAVQPSYRGQEQVWSYIERTIKRGYRRDEEGMSSQ